MSLSPSRPFAHLFNCSGHLFCVVLLTLLHVLMYCQAQEELGPRVLCEETNEFYLWHGTKARSSSPSNLIYMHIYLSLTMHPY